MSRLLRPSHLQLLRQALARPVSRLLATKPSDSVTLSYPTSLLQVPDTKISVLKNGLRVASENTGGETATVGMWIDVGSRYETAKNNGVAHFLEHLAFKGTTKRTQTNLELEIENMGAHLNAYTSREQTVYYAKTFKKDVPKAVEILSDLLQNSNLSSKDIDNERSVILTEMQVVEAQIPELVLDHLNATAFQGSGLSQTILGPIENIKSLQRQDLKAFVKEHYTGPRMVLAAAGAVDHDQLVQLAEKAFGGLPAEDNQKAFSVPRFVGSEVRLRNDEATEAHIAMAVEGPSWTSPDYFPMMVTQFVLGSWDRSLGGGRNLSSKLAQNVAQYNLCSSYTTFNTAYADTGLFGFYIISGERDRLGDLMHQFEIDSLRTCANVTDAEVEAAKNQLKAAFLMQIDGTTPVCEDIGRQMLIYGRRLPAFEINARVDAVDADSVRRVASKYLYDKDPAIVAYGPIESLPSRSK